MTETTAPIPQDPKTQAQVGLILMMRDADACLEIIEGRQPPDPELRRAGWDAHAAGIPFGDGPKPLHTVKGLCWRIGWNDRALGKPR